MEVRDSGLFTQCDASRRTTADDLWVVRVSRAALLPTLDVAELEADLCWLERIPSVVAVVKDGTVDAVVQTVFRLLSQPGTVVITEPEALRLLPFHHVLSHMISLSVFETPDAVLSQLIADQPPEDVRWAHVVLLLSPHTRHPNHHGVSHATLWDVSPTLASHWYVAYLRGLVPGISNPTVLENLQRHVRNPAIRDRLAYPFDQSGRFRELVQFVFESSYVCQFADRELKRAVARWVRSTGWAAIADGLLAPPPPSSGVGAMSVLPDGAPSGRLDTSSRLSVGTPSDGCTVALSGSPLQVIVHGRLADVFQSPAFTAALDLQICVSMDSVGAPSCADPAVFAVSDTRLRNLTPGRHTLHVWAEDRFGRVTAPSVVTITASPDGTTDGSCVAQARPPSPPTTSRPRVLLVSDYWRPHHSVVNALGGFVDDAGGMVDVFDVDVVTVEPASTAWVADNADKLRFRNLLAPPARVEDIPVFVAGVRARGYAAVVFASVGMTATSAVLANLRMAPVQAATYGHFVSTFADEMDYWLAGEDLNEDAANDFSECVIRVPGTGLVFRNALWRSYSTPTPAATPAPPQWDGTPVVVNVQSTALKLSATWLDLLQAVQRQARRRVVFRFYLRMTGSMFANDAWASAALSLQLRRAFGPNGFVIVGNVTGTAYLDSLAAGRLFLVGFPLGGSNSIVDPLVVGQPVVVLHTNTTRNYFFNAVGRALLTQLGLPQFVTSTRQAFVDTAVALIDSDGVWMAARQAVADAGVRAVLEAQRRERVGDHARAVAEALQNHPLCG